MHTCTHARTHAHARTHTQRHRVGVRLRYLYNILLADAGLDAPSSASPETASPRAAGGRPTKPHWHLPSSARPTGAWPCPVRSAGHRHRRCTPAAGAVHCRRPARLIAACAACASACNPRLCVSACKIAARRRLYVSASVSSLRLRVRPAAPAAACVLLKGPRGSSRRAWAVQAGWHGRCRAGCRAARAVAAGRRRAARCAQGDWLAALRVVGSVRA
jgi:hypothetical protein